MSDAPAPPMTQPDPHDAHATPIRTPRQLVTVIIAAFVLPVVIIILLVNFVAMGDRSGAGSTGMSPEAVARRLQPVGTVEIRAEGAAGAAARTGEQVYQAQCSACHATGAANAPKFGDAAAWKPRIATGFDSLVTSATKGKGAMPPQASGDTSELEVARAVAYIANNGGAKFAEPAAPAAAASAASAASAPK
ncbi:MAG: cytochrome c5 family protein [Rubrivivax sp.]|nr:cytochrome c5 family protein [Rubrivivax sp.]